MDYKASYGPYNKEQDVQANIEYQEKWMWNITMCMLEINWLISLTYREGGGNPFNVATLSGQPLTEDMTTALERALQKSGYQMQVSRLKTLDLLPPRSKRK